MHGLVGDPLRDDCAHPVAVVADDAAFVQAMAGGGQRLDQIVTRTVVLRGARVGDGQHAEAQRD